MTVVLLRLRKHLRLVAISGATILVAIVAYLAARARRREERPGPSWDDERIRISQAADRKRAIANTAAALQIQAATTRDAELKKDVAGVMAIKDERERLRALIRLRNGQRPGGGS